MAEKEKKTLFTETSRFKGALALINNIAPEKFPLLLTRIVQKLAVKDEKPFTDEEESQLQTMLKLSAVDLTQVLDACAYIFEQAAYQSISPKVLGTNLVEVGLEVPQAQAAVQVWTVEAGALLSKLRTMTLGGPKILQGSSWRMHLQMGQSGLTRLSDPCAVFEMSSGDADPSSKTADENEKFMVEFNHDELYDFFLKIERIQEQLDGLS